MKRLLASLVLIGGCILVSTQAKARKCFAPEPGDSRDFGFALALSDSYLAVGDPKANRVVLYSKANGRWSRTGEILPPEGSAAAKVGAGFGYDLDLDGSLLVIGAYTERHKPDSQDGFQWTNQLGVSYSGGVYKVLLDSPAKVERIDSQEEGEISGFSVAADDGKVAFGIGGVESRVKLWSGGEVEKIIPPTDTDTSVLDMNGDLLLVGAPSVETGAAWLLNLLQPDSAPQRLAIPGATAGHVVAISSQFAVIGAPGPLYPGAPGLYPKDIGLIESLISIIQDGSIPQGPAPIGPPAKTLIMNMKDGSTTVLDGAGYLSLDRHLLVRTYREFYDGSPRPQLELFDLGDATAPRLIARRLGSYRASIHNGTLVTVKEYSSDPKLCIEQGIQ